MTTISRPAVDKAIVPGYFSMYTEVHDDKYHLIVTDLIVNATREMLYAEISASLYSPAEGSIDRGRDHLRIILSNYASLCISIYEQQLPWEYVDFFYRNFSTMRRLALCPHSARELADTLYAYSPDAGKGFLAMLLETDSLRDIEAIVAADSELADLLTALCDEKLSLHNQEQQKYSELRKMIQDSGTRGT